MAERESLLAHGESINGAPAEAPPGLFRTLSVLGEAASPASDPSKLSTVMGVFVPVTLSIFGVILFERLPWCTGQAGLFAMLGIIAMGYMVVTLTTLSISAIASNGKVKGGGAYFMISRSLGPEFGGSIGIIFYAANVVGSALYLVGLSDALISAFEGQIPTSKWAGIAYSSGTLLAVTIVSLVGASAYAKTSGVIFVVLTISIVSVVVSLMFGHAKESVGFTSWSAATLSSNLYPKFSQLPAGVKPVNIRSTFAVFFPACSGIMAGANMSGDLRTPSKSIPSGTLVALAITCVIYAFIAFLCAYTVKSETLLVNYFVLQKIDFTWALVTVGIVCSTVSSALGNLIGSSRILQALAKDKLVPILAPFSRGYGPTDEPRLAVLLSWALVQALLIVGNLNLLASTATMFFLVSYAMVNFACFALKLSGATNWRPTFRYNSMYTSLLGAVLCFVTMFVVGWITATISFVLLVILFTYIHLQAHGEALGWGHLSQAILYHQVRKYLLRLDVRKDHVKYWRPQILLLIGSARSNLSLIDTANNLKKGGLFVIGSVLVGDLYSQGARFLRDQHAWNAFIQETHIKAFSELTIASSVAAGAQNLIEMAGLGAMKPNTVIVGFPEFDDFGVDVLRRIDGAATDDPADASTAAGTSARPTGVLAFPLSRTTTVASDELGARTVSQYRAKMIDAVEDNFVGDSESGVGVGPSEWVTMLRSANFLRKNIIVARHFASLDKDLIASKARAAAGGRLPFRRKRVSTIDIWPIDATNDGDFVHTLTLMLLYAHILNRTDIWRRFTRLRVLSIVAADADADAEHIRLAAVLAEARIQADIQIVVMPPPLASEWAAADPNTFGAAPPDRMAMVETRYRVLNAIYREWSADACLVFASVSLPPDRGPALGPEYVHALDLLTHGLPPTFLLHGIGVFITSEI